MWTLGPLGFTAPLLLTALITLPILWLLLRAVPPAPIKRRFPGVALLLGLTDKESQSDRTPWWLLLLRLTAIAALIIGFAGPVLNPSQVKSGSGDLVIAVDGSWAGAPTWSAKTDRIDALLSDASRNNRRTAIVNLADLPTGEIPFAAASTWQDRLANLQPQPWQPTTAATDWLTSQTGDFETFWLSDGIDWTGRDDLLTAFETHGPVSVFQSPRTTYGLRPPTYEEGEIIVSAIRTPMGNSATIPLTAIGLDPAGVERPLQTIDLTFDAGAPIAQTALVLPPELRNRVTRFELTGQRSAAAVSLTDDSLKRRKVALIAGADNREALDLLSPLHYLREALAPSADLINGTINDLILANPDVIILADVATLGGRDSEAVQKWVEDGGLLVRFAGPRLAASDLGRSSEAPLLPVRLRDGGRTVGGAMSWGEPKALADFNATSPFAGLQIPTDVTVSAQVMAQPDPNLADRVIADLTDGTPLVTRKTLGLGQVVLFHVTANAEWSTLPLSGLFVQMLERLAISTRAATSAPTDLAGTTWLPATVLDGFGRLQDGKALAGIDGALLTTRTASPTLRPGLYTGPDAQIAVNVIDADTSLSPAVWPARIPVEGLTTTRETALKGWLLTAALTLLALDIIASLLVGGRLRGPRGNIAAALIALMLFTPDAQAQSDDAKAIAATSQVVLAHVLTGDKTTDDIAQAGLRGVSRTLFQRTSIEPADPVSVNIETDELAFFPFIYWPVTPDQALPSRDAYSKLNRYLRAGGMIMFDTRDADTASFGSGSPEGRKLQAIARGLDIPAIEPIPDDHVLTRTFYLLQDFPGRYASRDIWVEAAPINSDLSEGMPFRNLNDGVTPVVIGGNDWARAWAIDDNGNSMFPVGRGTAGERQREIALRFGVNLIMHVLTGNYKSDQVHVPALLDRLGQ
ncbi:DUF4159 domain-containing protein [Yoonia sp. MH D7]